MDKCNAEQCINWTGSGCVCDVMGLDKEEAHVTDDEMVAGPECHMCPELAEFTVGRKRCRRGHGDGLHPASSSDVPACPSRVGRARSGLHLQRDGGLINMTETLAVHEVGVLSELHGRVSVKYTPEELRRLRELVKCVHCGAVPTETGETREVDNGRGDKVTLPYVVTPHAEGCAGVTKIGRPPKKEPKWRQVPAGDCLHCGSPMVASFAHAAHKKYCDVSCRKAYAKRAAVSS